MLTVFLEERVSLPLSIRRMECPKSCPNEAFSIQTLMIFDVDSISANQGSPNRPQVQTISRNFVKIFRFV